MQYIPEADLRYILDKYNDVKDGDVIEAYLMEEIKN